MQLKKILAIFLAAALIFSVVPVYAAAETNGILEVGVVAETTAPISSSPWIINQGDEISVKISADQNTGVSFLRFVTFFDANAFEYVGHESAKLFGPNESIQVKNGYLIFFVDLSRGISDATGVIYTLKLKAKTDYCGTSIVRAEPVNGNSANCSVYKSNSVNTHVPFVCKELSMMVHNIDATTGVVTPPTCLDEGYTTYVCTGCKESVVGNIVPATGHFPAEAVEENRVEATCTTTGSYDMAVYCSVCNAELSRENHVIPATGHFEAEAVEENRVEATCTTDGSYDMVVYCSVCNVELSRVNHVIPMTGHTAGEAVEENRVEATCTTDGSYDLVVYCTVCNAEISREAKVIPMLGHDEIAHAAQAPTCTEIGWDAYVTCSRCDYTTYKELAANGHTFGDATVFEPDYQVDGYSVHTCTICQYEEKFDIVPGLTYIFGDFNGDLVVNNLDVEYLLWATLYPEDYPLISDADYNDDGVVNNLDVEYLLWHTLYPEDYPLR